MKKNLLIVFILTLAVIAAGIINLKKSKEYAIRVVVPAGTAEKYVYSDEEISPFGDTITISASEGLGDTLVLLKPIEVKEENAYEPTYITPGMPVKIDVEKGAWFRVGVLQQNMSDEDYSVGVNVKGVEVRIE